MIWMQKSHRERSCCQEDRGIMSQRLFIPRTPLDIKLTDYPFVKERSNRLLSLPFRRETGVGSAHKQNKPQQKAGANVSFILGHFQKCLTGLSTYAILEMLCYRSLHDGNFKDKLEMVRNGT